MTNEMKGNSYGISNDELINKIVKNYVSVRWEAELSYTWENAFANLMIPRDEFDNDGVGMTPYVFLGIDGKHSEVEGELMDYCEFEELQDFLFEVHYEELSIERLLEDEGEYPMPHLEFIKELFKPIEVDGVITSAIKLIAKERVGD